MLGLRSERRLPVLLTTLCVVLMWVVYRQVSDSTDPSTLEVAAFAEEAEPPSRALTPRRGAVQAPARDLIDSMVRRPLFSPTRRPHKPAAAEPITPKTEPKPKPQQPKLSVVLLGTVLSENERAALVIPMGEAEGLALHEGDTIQDWVVTSIGAGEIVFEREGEKQTVVLEYSSPQ